MQQPLDTAQREILKLSEALLLCQHELAQVREIQEPLQEECSRLHAQNTESLAAAAQLGQALAAHLSWSFWEEREPKTAIRWRRFFASRWPRLRKRFAPRRSTTVLASEQEVRLLESSPLFQSTWYLREYPDVALAGIHPPSHYLEAGAREGRDPGPDFSTSGYLDRHPEVETSGVNPLVHHLQAATTDGR